MIIGSYIDIGAPAMKTDPELEKVPWHKLSKDELFSQLQTGPTGLTQAIAAERLKTFGNNELKATTRVTPFSLLIEQFKNVLIIILLVATVLSGFLGHTTEAIAIGVIVLFAVLLGFIQEYRAERAIEALRKMTAPTATVLRDGEENELAAAELVPGDVIFLRAGDRIPADVRLIESINLKAEESALTGESVAVEKHAAAIASDELPIGDRRNMGYAGTAVTYGRGTGVVAATGMSTEFGRIATMLQSVETGRTPLQDNLDRAGKMLARIAFIIVAVIVALGMFRGQPFTEMLIFGIALAVAVVPEALPAVVTISLALSVQKMVRRNALMRRLPAVETLGSTSIICSDKTGTLTKDEMTVRRVYVAGDMLQVSGSGYEPVGEFSLNNAKLQPDAALTSLLTAAALSSDAHIIRIESDQLWHVKGDPTEGALVVMAAKAGLHKADLDAIFPRTGEIPFSSESKRMTTLHSTEDSCIVYSKGAPEVILASCASHLSAKGESILDEAGRAEILEAARQMAADALRVLAVASRVGGSLENSAHDLTFLGLVGMIDPPRPEARAAIQTCEKAGIKVVMITGDHPLTARAVASELGLLKNGRVITGAELAEMNDSEFEKCVNEIEVYARVSPADKLRVVTALQKQDHIVAMTGDGVNDAPALKKADIGIAMGITGTDVTKEAAAMTLTDDNFASIVAAVEEGRGIFGNIKKYLMYLLSANIGEIGLMAGATLLGLPLPLSAVQILYVNLATDGLPALALAIDPPEKDLMNRKPRNPRTGIFTRPVIALMLAGGAWSTIVNLLVFYWALNSGRSIPQAMTMTFVCLVLIEFFKAYNFRSDRLSITVRPFANKWLNLAVVWELALLGAIIYLPVMQLPFGTFSLTALDWCIAIAAAFTVTPVLELGKWMVRKGWFGELD
jgi:P-type Ca2+ transporter type 2C